MVCVVSGCIPSPPTSVKPARQQRAGGGGYVGGQGRGERRERERQRVRNFTVTDWAWGSRSAPTQAICSRDVQAGRQAGSDLHRDRRQNVREANNTTTTHPPQIRIDPISRPAAPLPLSLRM
mmetsp:Transcript_3770/g.9431  ORF Transcript_3770/g.9431 Transcript_3770/m.9431 type:complete len:122 (-) Transcript_3770:74-439(-)